MLCLFKIIRLAVLLVIWCSPVTSSSGFLYNNDAECTVPFSETSIVDISCLGNQRQTQANEEIVDGGCYFGDAMMVFGSFALDQQVNRYFTLKLDVCYYGSVYLFYKPQRCKTHQRTIDMRDYALMEEEGEESDFEEGYNYQSYWQDENRQQWEEEREAARAEQAEAEQTYLLAGVYSFGIGLSIPRKHFTFGNGSQLRVKATLTPRDSYYLKYYQSTTRYNAAIKDSKYKTECYLTFDAIPVDESQQFYNYYTMAGIGALLVGAATYVSSKRRVLCSCDPCTDDNEQVVDASYQRHVELPVSTQDDFNIDDGGASIMTT